MYIGYEVYLKTLCCKKMLKIELFDYYLNAITRRNQLIESFGKDNVTIKKYIKKG